MKQLRDVKIEDILFLNTETVRNQEDLIEGTPDYDAWKYKMERSLTEQDLDIYENYKDKSALYPEFSRLVCISVLMIRDGRMIVKTYSDLDEQKLLKSFMRDLDLIIKKKPNLMLCGHSVKGFDIPFIFKRCIVKKVIPNKLIDVGGLKPWEVTALDTKELWKASSYYSSSLITLCLALSVPSPKGDINGSEVGDVFYSEGQSGIDRICKYCERDTIATAQCVLVMRFDEMIPESMIEYHVPSEPAAIGLIERIGYTGIIEKSDRDELILKMKDCTYEEKEIAIKLVKAALAINKIEMPEDLELEMLR